MDLRDPRGRHELKSGFCSGSGCGAAAPVLRPAARPGRPATSRADTPRAAVHHLRTTTTAHESDLDVTMPPADDEQKRVERSYLRYAGAGVEFFAGVAALTLLGVWADGRLGTTPFLTIVGVLLGFAASSWNLIRGVLRTDEPPHKAAEPSPDEDEQP